MYIYIAIGIITASYGPFLVNDMQINQLVLTHFYWYRYEKMSVFFIMFNAYFGYQTVHQRELT